jgi:putative membrane protein
MRPGLRAVTTAVALGSWAGLFWFLMLSGRTSLYLSSRTDWVVPMGAVILSLAALGRFFTGRHGNEGVTRRDALGMGVLALPVVAILSLPPASLSSFAASRRSSYSSAGFMTSAEDVATGDLSLADVAGALRSRGSMRALVQRAGTEASFIGFVTRDAGQPADEFVLTRFMISCCVADALSVQVRVVGATPGEFGQEEWVRVTGAMYPLGSEVIVDATEIERVPKPAKPYLNP